MKRLISSALIAFFALSYMAVNAKGGRFSGHTSGTGSKSSSTYVHGHTTNKGHYVAPHHRTTPDKTQRNNYAARGNTNPHNGKTGHKSPRR